jgi:predicted DsbA family dithiol-disulfide isomerase
MPIDVTEFTDPGCPWAYSANPDLALLQWRYGSGLRWRMVTIGLTAEREQYLQRGYTPERAVKSQRSFARFGMPFSHEMKPGVAATQRMCRAIVATRLQDPERERHVFRNLAFGQFTTPLVMDEDASILERLRHVAGLDAEAIIAALDSDEVTEAYEADRAEARTAEGGATHFQGKHATSDGPVRYTAPSLIFTAEDGRSLEAGGFQNIQAYDVCIANLDRSLERRPAPEDPLEALQAFRYPLVTAEVVAIMTPDLRVPDREAVENALIDHVAAGRVERIPLGDDALWAAIP